jgi:hypothetical protein
MRCSAELSILFQSNFPPGPASEFANLREEINTIEALSLIAAFSAG